MKLNINISWLCIIAVLLFMITGVDITSAQDNPLTTRIDLTCEQSEISGITLVGQGRYKEGNAYLPLVNQEFEFFTYIEGEEITLGTAITNESGYARLPVQEMNGWDIDEDQYYSAGINYSGNDQYEDNFEEISFKRAKFLIATDDSEEKTIEVQFLEINDEEEIPIEDIEIAISVPMMFSELIIGSEYSDEEGKVSFTFPDDLPGDEIGNITFITKTIDADDYGVIVEKNKQTWGVPKAEVIHQSRQLWSPDAPLWMVITFTMLMATVWGFFIHIIFKLINIKNEGKLDPA